MEFEGQTPKLKTYFWERIAFRISLGFLLPIVVSAYALYSVSTVFTELSENKERVQRIWNSIHLTEGRSMLSVTKLRLSAQSYQLDPNPDFVAQSLGELREFKNDLDQSRNHVQKQAVDSGIPMEVQISKFYGQIGELQRELGAEIERFGQIGRTGSSEAQALRHHMDATAESIETTLGKLRAVNELYETKILEKLQLQEEYSSRTLIFFLVAVGVFGIIAAVLVTASITGPVRRVSARLVDIATGEGDLTKRINVRGGGEVSELAAWVNVFLDKTHSIIGTIANGSQIVRATTDQVGGHTRKTMLAAAGLTRTTMEQSMDIDECTNSLGGIDDLIQNADESTRQAASLSKIAMDRALQGGASVGETIEAMEKIEESSAKIDRLVSSINEIASQTNLLAINAAIEATKAGEHGKGFAVVAEEVRKLAERARKMTGEVTTLMAESDARVKAGVTLAKNAGISLDGIIKDVEAVSSLIQRIAASSAKQTESSAHVLDFMQKVAGSVRTNLDEMKEVSRVSELTAMEVQKLDALVGQLNQIVGQFRLDHGSIESTNFYVGDAATAAAEDADTDTGIIEPEAPRGLPPMPEAALTEHNLESADQAEASRPASMPGLPPLPPSLPRSPGGGEEDAA